MELSHANLRVDTYEYTVCDNFKILACNIFISQSFYSLIAHFHTS
jgi:hypothetical protein